MADTKIGDVSQGRAVLLIAAGLLLTSMIMFGFTTAIAKIKSQNPA